MLRKTRGEASWGTDQPDSGKISNQGEGGEEGGCEGRGVEALDIGNLPKINFTQLEQWNTILTIANVFDKYKIV